MISNFRSFFIFTEISEDPCCQQVRISYNGVGVLDHPDLLGIYNFEKATHNASRIHGRFKHIKETYSLYPSNTGWKVSALYKICNIGLPTI